MINSWPKQSDVLTYKSVYGSPAGKNGNASAQWEAENLGYVNPKFTLWMGDIKISKFRMHKHCVPSAQRVMDSLFAAARGNLGTLAEWGVTKFGGTYNFRVMRGLTTLSMHSFGCAIDLDPANNGLGDTTPRFASIPEVLKAFGNEGWKWGGDWNGNGSSADERRADGMHWQATS